MSRGRCISVSKLHDAVAFHNRITKLWRTYNVPFITIFGSLISSNISIQSQFLTFKAAFNHSLLTICLLLPRIIFFLFQKQMMDGKMRLNETSDVYSCSADVQILEGSKIVFKKQQRAFNAKFTTCNI